MATIDIDADTCIKCTKCVKVCPALIFGQGDTNSNIFTKHIETCIICGQCVAVCPTDSVIHSAFPPEKVHEIDETGLPSWQQVMNLLKTRRSYRTFSSKPVPMELLDQILDAAHAAPTAENMQQVQYTLVTDPQKLHDVVAATIGIYASIIKKVSLIKPLIKMIAPEIYEQLSHLQSLVDDFASNKDRILRGATALILIHTPSDVRFGRQDSNLAYQNASIMAQSLGVGQFYTGYICAASDMAKNNRIIRLLGIKGKIHAGMALGMPTLTYPKYVDKKEIVVTKF